MFPHGEYSTENQTPHFADACLYLTDRANFVKAVEGDPLRRLFFSTDRDEPFAAMHELADQGV